MSDLRTWFGSTAVATPEGLPRHVYHATDCSFAIFAHSNDFGFHFGPIEAANTRCTHIGDDGAEVRVMPVYLRIENPLRIRDCFTWDLRNMVGEAAELGAIAPEVAEHILESDDGDNLFKAALENAGHDGIVYSNVTEGGGDSYLVWRAEQIKSVFAADFSADSPFLSGIAATDKAARADYQAWENDRRALDEAKVELGELSERLAATRVPSLPAEQPAPGERSEPVSHSRDEERYAGR